MPQKIDFSEVISRLRRFTQEQRRPPSIQEIASLFSYKSKNAAFELVNKLVQKGLLRKDSQGKILFDSLMGTKLLGTVQAGWPSPAEEELVDTLSLDEYLIQRPEQTFLIKVTGDSMIDAGIQEGDLVLVERGRQAKDGDIIVAQVDGDWTMKFYQKKGQEVWLVPANKKYTTIKPKQELVVGGVIVGVVRKYR